MRGKASITTKPHVVSNCEEIGRCLIDQNDIETDIEDGPAEKTIAVEHMIEAFVDQHPRLFKKKPAGEDGETQVVYIGSESDE